MLNRITSEISPVVAAAAVIAAALAIASAVGKVAGIGLLVRLGGAELWMTVAIACAAAKFAR